MDLRKKIEERLREFGTQIRGLKRRLVSNNNHGKYLKKELRETKRKQKLLLDAKKIEEDEENGD